MTAIQKIRDKIHKLDGKEFKPRDLISTDKRDYFNLRALVDMRELECQGSGRNAVYRATGGLKRSKPIKSKEAPQDLIGWRTVFPSMFNPVVLKGNKIVHKEAMV